MAKEQVSGMLIGEFEGISVTDVSSPHEICACISFVVRNRFGLISLKLN